MLPDSVTSSAVMMTIIFSQVIVHRVSPLMGDRFSQLLTCNPTVASTGLATRDIPPYQRMTFKASSNIVISGLGLFFVMGNSGPHPMTVSVSSGQRETQIQITAEAFRFKNPEYVQNIILHDLVQVRAYTECTIQVWFGEQFTGYSHWIDKIRWTESVAGVRESRIYFQFLNDTNAPHVAEILFYDEDLNRAWN